MDAIDYPECDFMSWGRPVDKKCPRCAMVIWWKKEINLPVQMNIVVILSKKKRKNDSKMIQFYNKILNCQINSAKLMIYGNSRKQMEEII